MAFRVPKNLERQFGQTVQVVEVGQEPVFTMYDHFPNRFGAGRHHGAAAGQGIQQRPWQDKGLIPSCRKLFHGLPMRFDARQARGEKSGLLVTDFILVRTVWMKGSMVRKRRSPGPCLWRAVARTRALPGRGA
jgi:hypothetical protein